MSLIMRKPAFYICENKDTEADLRLCFRYTDSTIPLLHRSKITSLKPSSVAVHTGLCWTWSETRKTCFLTTRLNYIVTHIAIECVLGFLFDFDDNN